MEAESIRMAEKSCSCAEVDDEAAAGCCAGEKIDMPVFFYIDPEFATDPRMSGINHLTLSYTFFNVEEEAVEVDGEVLPAAELLGRQRHQNPAHVG